MQHCIASSMQQKQPDLFRSDFVFSYWVFAWFLLYMVFSKTKNIDIQIVNPKFAIIVGIAENVLLLLFLLVKKSSVYKITKFVLINVFLKAIPLYLLWDTKIQWWDDVYFTVFLFVVYLGWLYINNLALVSSYKTVIHSYMTDDNVGDKKTWLSYMFDRLVLGG